MSKRSQQKTPTIGSRTLRFLREQSNLSMRQAGKLAGYNGALINHLENGRLNISVKHLSVFLPLYGSNQKMFDLFTSGHATLPKNIKAKCLELLSKMDVENLKQAFSKLKEIANTDEIDKMVK